MKRIIVAAVAITISGWFVGGAMAGDDHSSDRSQPGTYESSRRSQDVSIFDQQSGLFYTGKIDFEVQFNMGAPSKRRDESLTGASPYVPYGGGRPNR